jgi:hypothetical protein
VVLDRNKLSAPLLASAVEAERELGVVRVVMRKAYVEWRAVMRMQAVIRGCGARKKYHLQYLQSILATARKEMGCVPGRASKAKIVETLERVAELIRHYDLWQPLSMNHKIQQVLHRGGGIIDPILWLLRGFVDHNPSDSRTALACLSVLCACIGAATSRERQQRDLAPLMAEGVMQTITSVCVKAAEEEASRNTLLHPEGVQGPPEHSTDQSTDHSTDHAGQPRVLPLLLKVLTFFVSSESSYPSPEPLHELQV